MVLWEIKNAENLMNLKNSKFRPILCTSYSSIWSIEVKLSKDQLIVRRQVLFLDLLHVYGHFSLNSVCYVLKSVMGLTALQVTELLFQ